MSLEEEKRLVIAVLRSLINSSKNIKVFDLIRDYRGIEDKEIPFAKFGARNVEDFLMRSGEFDVSRDKYVSARANANSAHVSKLVAETRTKKRKTNAPRRLMRPSGTQQFPTSAFSNHYRNQQSGRKVAPSVKYPLTPKLQAMYNNALQRKPSHEDKASFVLTNTGTLRMLTNNNDAQQQTAKGKHQQQPHQFRPITKSIENIPLAEDANNQTKPQHKIDLQKRLNQNKPDESRQGAISPNDLRWKLQKKENARQQTPPPIPPRQQISPNSEYKQRTFSNANNSQQNNQHKANESSQPASYDLRSKLQQKQNEKNRIQQTPPTIAPRQEKAQTFALQQTSFNNSNRNNSMPNIIQNYRHPNAQPNWTQQQQQQPIQQARLQSSEVSKSKIQERLKLTQSISCNGESVSKLNHRFVRSTSSVLPSSANIDSNNSSGDTTVPNNIQSNNLVNKR